MDWIADNRRHLPAWPAWPARAARRPCAASVLSVLSMVLALAWGARLPAAGAGPLTVVSVQHEVSGRISAALSGGDPEAEVADVRAVIDGVPYPVEVLRETARPVSVVIAIDTSGSMQGEPLEAARRAAIGLVERLDADDRVAVISFSDQPYLMSTFADGPAGAVAGIGQIFLGGNTSLYDALSQSLTLLGPEDGRTRAVVLLSDGQDTVAAPEAQAARRAEVLAAVAASQAQLHTFALGAEADQEFLAEASTRGDGGFWSVTDASALAELFAYLGARLGATTEISIAVPPLERGEHELVLRARVDGQPTEARAVFEARNDQLLTVIQRPASDGGPIVLDLASIVAMDALTVTASVGDRPLEVLPSPPRVLVDPWTLAPGAVEVLVRVSRAGATVAEVALPVEVLALEPELSFALVPAEGEAPEGVLTGRTQGVEDARLVVREGTSDGGEIVAEGATPTLRFALPEGTEALRFELAAGGEVLRSTTHALPLAPPAEARSLPLGPVAVAVVLLAAAGGGAWLLRERARGGAGEWQPSGRMALVGKQQPGASSEARSALGVVVVHTPAGEAREYELRRKPLSVGSGAECDVQIHDEGVAPVHARFYAIGDGEFRIHGIAPRGVPDRLIRDDEWIVVRHGEQIAIGRHVITVYAAEGASARGGAA